MVTPSLDMGGYPLGGNMFFLYLSFIFWGFALLCGVAHVIGRVIEHERKPDIF